MFSIFSAGFWELFDSFSTFCVLAYSSGKFFALLWGVLAFLPNGKEKYCAKNAKNF